VGCIMYHMLTGHVPFTADNFMGILTKHLLEAPVPPRKRRPDLQIVPDVEAICLKAMEKDRDKRYTDMDALYRALGAAGDFAFEPSTVFVAPRVPKPSLKYPTLAAANPEARESRTAIASSSGSGTFEDERPGRFDDAAGGKRSPAKIAMVAVGLALGVGGVVFALRPSSTATPPAPPPVAAKPAAAAPAAGAPTPAAPVAPTPAAPAAAAPSETPKPAAAATPASDPPRPSRSRRRRAAEEEEPKPDPLHRAIPVPAEVPGDIKPFPTN